MLPSEGVMEQVPSHVTSLGYSLQTQRNYQIYLLSKYLHITQSSLTEIPYNYSPVTRTGFATISEHRNNLTISVNKKINTNDLYCQICMYLLPRLLRYKLQTMNKL